MTAGGSEMRIGVTVMSLWGTNKLVPIQSNGNIGNIGYQICLENPYFQLTAILTPGLDGMIDKKLLTIKASTWTQSGVSIPEALQKPSWE